MRYLPTDQLKYGRVESERRFLLAALPSRDYAPVYRIEDRYLRGTRLRLRRMEDQQGRVAFKLAKKLPPHRPGCGVMGNLYLDAAEFEILQAAPADLIVKRRHYLGDWSTSATLPAALGQQPPDPGSSTARAESVDLGVRDE